MRHGAVGTETVMKTTLAGALAVLILLGQAAGAQDRQGPVVVELFTSQGCSSCPPADALLGELAMREDVIALALHVDYWDYIGWEDTFAMPEMTQRQHGYAYAAGSTVVYTPQIIIGGQDHVVGVRPMAVADLIQAHASAPDPVSVSLIRDAGGLALRAEAHMDPPRPQMVVQVVTFSPHEEMAIERGERAGTTAHHYNVVTSWQVVAEWDGANPFAARIEPQSDLPLVVIVQQRDHGPILGAARLD
ncbi:hypothetical protein C7455_10485 [Roseicyclus mahoneyensis]|uniref:Uncharacterized protein n=2 Tax=Roseicyclus mahoneyensis TaxID=164332 RepID=A0A316GZ85_9RHOB|nr:hypothetical protein C7455_10485 [Roseicyclus mahoneyensis]